MSPVPRPVDLSILPVVDGHCHPLLPDPWTITPETFVTLFSEGRPGTMTAHIPQTGYYRRALRALAGRLGVEPTVEAVLARRRALGPDAARRALIEHRVAALLADTGYPPGAMPLADMRRLLECPIHEVFRIETCAEALLARALPWEDFLEAFRQEARTAAERCVALKTIVAYRSGLAIRDWNTAEIRHAHERALARREAGGPPRLVEKALLDTLVGEALAVSRATGRPLQIHTGFGDPDIDLGQANPVLLRPIVEDPRWAGVRIVLLHLAYPYTREAAFMAAVWPQVYVDLSLALPFLGPGSIPALIEVLSLAPASKLLYGSDVGGLPELFGLAADWARAALGEALGWLAERGGMSRDEAHATGRQILSENAVALYRLPTVE
ncbi:MAG: amidohydrolase family protein [Candidatus Rokubacteria bacterium]|nr:amidohydrolase family protein [Candidatus Rokubacteria bacterium]